VTLVSASPYVIAVNPAVPADNLRELVDYAKKNPDKLSFGSSGVGAASHLSAELFKSMAGIEMLHVPYKGTGQAVTDLLAGQIQVMFAPAQTVMPHVQAGRLKAFAVTSAKRSATLPDLPTAAEAGVRGYEAVGWFGLLAPAATPPAVVAKLSRDANRVLADGDVKQKMLVLGADPSGDTPEQFARFIHDDMAKWAKLVRDRNIAIE
jgi:tripartite-type tricarboxylate transporter receptor subunit TctC